MPGTHSEACYANMLPPTDSKLVRGTQVEDWVDEMKASVMEQLWVEDSSAFSVT